METVLMDVQTSMNVPQTLTTVPMKPPVRIQRGPLPVNVKLDSTETDTSAQVSPLTFTSDTNV